MTKNTLDRNHRSDSSAGGDLSPSPPIEIDSLSLRGSRRSTRGAVSLGETDERDGDIAKLRERLSAAVARICPRSLRDHQEDLVQAGLIRVLRARQRQAGQRPLLDAYLKKVAYAVLVDEIRKAKSRPQVALAEDAATHPHSPATPGAPVIVTPEDQAGQLQLGRRIYECLSELKPQRRQAVALYLEGYTAPEAAQLLGWSRKRTENLIYRGLADLRERLRAKGVRP